MYDLPGNLQKINKSASNSQVDEVEKLFLVKHLPKTVTMNADVLLNATEVSNNGYEGIFYYNGEFKNILGSRKSTINANLGLAEGIIKGENKKTVKMECVLDNIGPDKSFNNLVIIGMRVMCYVPNSFGSADADDKISIKLFNRYG